MDNRNSQTAEESATKKWYEDYYTNKGKIRNDLLLNPEVDLQKFSADLGMLRALRNVPAAPHMLVLDVGGGGGGLLPLLIECGFEPERYVCVDINGERIDRGRSVFPNATFVHANAETLLFGDEHFDLTFSSTMFCQILDDRMAKNILSEMGRVTKKNGAVLIRDWTTHYSPKGYRMLTKARLRGICPESLSIEKVEKGALLPPLGRFLSKYVPSLYFPARFLFPPLVAQSVYVLRRVSH